MSFVQTGFLIACAAAAIPVLVHLLSRWQVRSVELGTARFLQEVIHDGAQRRKIRRWLLLVTRMALVTLLALLFARPFLPEWTRRDGDRLRIVMVDRSSSMGMPGQNGRLVDDAVAAAADAVAELGDDADLVWAWFDRHVEPLSETTTRPNAPRAVVGDTDYLAALEWARDRLHADRESIADVVLVTDLQQSGMVAESIAKDSLGFPRDVPVRIIDVGRPAANNLAITGVRVPAAYLDSEQKTTLSVTLFNHGTLPFEEVPLSASAFDGQRTIRLKKSISLPGGQAEEVPLDFGRLDPATWRITVALDVDDDLAADNRRQTAVQVAEPVAVLVLDPGSRDDGVAAKSYYLAAAIEHTEIQDRETTEGDDASLNGRFRADVHFLEDEAAPAVSPTSNPLVVVADAGSLSRRSIEQLEEYVRQGGKLLVFAGDGAGGDVSQVWRQTKLAPGQLGPPQRSGAMPFRIVSASGRGTMLEPFEDPQHGDLSRLAFQKLLPVSADDSTEVLAWFDADRPALTRHPVGSGRVVWFLSSADATWGSWTTSPLYLPLVQQMIGDLLNLTGEGPIRFRSLGDPQPLPHQAVGSGTETAQASSAAVSRRGSEIRFSQPGFVQREDTLYVVNGAEKESDPARIEPEMFAEHFDLTLASNDRAAVSESIDGKDRNELWPWLAAAILVLCVGEFTLANRTSA